MLGFIAAKFDGTGGSGFLLRYVSRTRTWEPMCVPALNKSFGNATCKVMGFRCDNVIFLNYLQHLSYGNFEIKKGLIHFVVIFKGTKRQRFYLC